ncbi:hypothetical protein RDI58_015314 [Solanum bulbocastanum]
MEVFI